MLLRPLALGALLCAALPARAASPLEEAIFELEDGPFYVLLNEGTYGVEGTTYDAADVNQQENFFYSFRLSLELRPWERHGLVLLWAPLPIDTTATLDESINFRGTLFEAGETVESSYDFDGYRGTYLYRLVDADAFSWDIGGALQIRNAYVSLRSGDGATYAQRSDIGIVPAVATRIFWWPAPSFYTHLEATGLSSFGIGDADGGLYDVALSIGLPLDERNDASIFLRTRVYGGGVDLSDDTVETWASFLFLTAGVRADLVGLIDRL